VNNGMVQDQIDKAVLHKDKIDKAESGWYEERIAELEQELNDLSAGYKWQKECMAELELSNLTLTTKGIEYAQVAEDLREENAALRADNISSGIRQFNAGMERAAEIADGKVYGNYAADDIRKEIANDPN
jgi:hypothetical protein